MADFCKNQMQRTYNENIRTRLKKSMTQADTYNNISAVNEISLNYERINNKGIILKPESLRIDITPKMESLMKIEIRKYIFLGMMAHISLCCLRQAGIQGCKRNTSHLPAQKWREH